MDKNRIEHIPTVGMAEVCDYTPSPAEEQLIQDFEAQADSDIAEQKKLPKNLVCLIRHTLNPP